MSSNYEYWWRYLDSSIQHTYFCNQTIAAPLSCRSRRVAACLSQGTFKILLRMCGNINEQQLWILAKFSSILYSALLTSAPPLLQQLSPHHERLQHLFQAWRTGVWIIVATYSDLSKESTCLVYCWQGFDAEAHGRIIFSLLASGLFSEDKNQPLLIWRK
jgi:hypothetical protein